MIVLIAKRCADLVLCSFIVSVSFWVMIAIYYWSFENGQIVFRQLMSLSGTGYLFVFFVLNYSNVMFFSGKIPYVVLSKFNRRGE